MAAEATDGSKNKTWSLLRQQNCLSTSEDNFGVISECALTFATCHERKFGCKLHLYIYIYQYRGSGLLCFSESFTLLRFRQSLHARQKGIAMTTQSDPPWRMSAWIISISSTSTLLVIHPPQLQDDAPLPPSG